MAQIDALIPEHLDLGCADSTNRSYRRAHRSFVKFADQFGLDIAEPSQKLLIRYCIWRRLTGVVKHATIRGEIYGVRNFFVRKYKRFSLSDYPAVALVLRGLKRDIAARGDIRRPLTDELLTKIYAGLDSARYDHVLARALLSFAKLNMLRVSEYAYDNGLPISKQCILRWGDIAFLPTASAPTRVVLRIRRSKGAQFETAEAGSSCNCAHGTCAVHDLLRYQRLYHEEFGRDLDAPVFRWASGGMVARQDVGRLIRKQVMNLGLDPRFYKPHSLRIGGACDWFRYGLDLTTVKLLGRWRSDTILIYIRLNVENILKAIEVQMATVRPAAHAKASAKRRRRKTKKAKKKKKSSRRRQAKVPKLEAVPGLEVVPGPRRSRRLATKKYTFCRDD